MKSNDSNDSLGRFRGQVIQKQLWRSVGLSSAGVAIMLTRHYSWGGQTPDFVSGMAVVSLSALAVATTYSLVKNTMALRDPVKLKELYIAETDERNMYIKQKAGSAGIVFIIYCLAIGAAVVGNINMGAFFALLGACLFVAAVKGFLKLYYRMKLR